MRQAILRVWLPALALLLSPWLIAGCASVDRSIAIAEMAVVPITAGEAADVSADNLATAMLRAGFTADEILKHGPALHNALATSGGAQVRQDQSVAAVFAIHSGELYVVSRDRGTFMQPLDGRDAPAAFLDAPAAM